MRNPRKMKNGGKEIEKREEKEIEEEEGREEKR